MAIELAHSFIYAIMSFYKDLNNTYNLVLQLIRITTNTIIYEQKAGSVKLKIRIHVSFVGKLKEDLEITA